MEHACLMCGARSVDGYQMHTSTCPIPEQWRREKRVAKRRRARLWRRLAPILNPRRVLWWVQDQWDWTSFWFAVIGIAIAVLLTWGLIALGEASP